MFSHIFLGFRFICESDFAGMRGRFFYVFLRFYVQKIRKMQKNAKKCKKIAKKFAYIKNLL